MKILQVIQAFSPMHGGSDVVAYHLSKELAKRGHEVTVYTSDFKLTQEYINCIPEVKVCPFKARLSLADEFYVTPAMIKSAKEEIKHFDVIHMHSPKTFQNIIVHYYAKKYGIPYVLQTHGDLIRGVDKQRVRKLYDWFFGYRILRDALKVIAVTKIEVEQCKQMGVDENRIEIIPNGIDPSEYSNLPGKGEFKRKFDIEDKYMILYVGRINIRKGVDFLVKSFFELIKDINDFTLVIVGPGEGYQNEIKKLITNLKLQNKIKFTGFVNERDKLTAYVDADLLVYPAIWEIFGLVPFEALMCGTPVIVTDDSGCGELIREANAGYLVKYGDIEGLKEKMKKTIENPEEGKEMVKRGRKYIKENLSWDKVVRKVEVLYEDCIYTADKQSEN